MSKIKDTIEETKNKELEQAEIFRDEPGYKYTDEKKAHLHSLNGKPLLGTSTVCGVIAKPLTWWASGQAVSMLGWSNPKLTGPQERQIKAGEVLDVIKGFDATSYLSLLDRAYKAHNEKKESSAEEGTDMHALLEGYVKKMITDQGGKPMLMNDDLEKTEAWARVQTFAKWAVENVEQFYLSEFNVYSKELWVGGICDLMFKMRDGKVMLGDFKSSKEAYLSQFIQIAGYDIQFSENGALDNEGRVVRVAEKIDGYVVFPFGAKNFEPAFRYNTEELKEGFRSATVLYKLTNQ